MVKGIDKSTQATPQMAQIAYKPGISEANLEGASSVSYTHLDVYKRQVFILCFYL